MNNPKLLINESLVRLLIAEQFPQWSDLPVKAVVPGGWDNRTFRLGEHMLVRMPSAAIYAAKVPLEHQWLPFLAQHLSYAIPQPLAMGNPYHHYLWYWSIYRWIDGVSANTLNLDNLQRERIAHQLAQFLNELRSIDTSDGPLPGAHNFYRGGNLAVYDAQTRQAIDLLKDKIEGNAVTAIWDKALASSWNQKPVWVHGDFSAGNILIKDGPLVTVIDFGGMAIGDPACDLVIAWTFLHGESRKIFRSQLALDDDTWERARGWALWKALIIVAGIASTNAIQGQECWRIIEDILAE